MKSLKEFAVFILIFTIIYTLASAFNVKFHWREDGLTVEPFKMRHKKRQTDQFFDKASFSFDGLEKIEAVPVLFAEDICLISLNGLKYAAALHRNKDGVMHFAVFKTSGAGSYEQLVNMPTPLAIAFDCVAQGERGYVALAYNLTAPVRSAQQGSPIYEIAGNRVRAVQYFAATDLRAVYLRTNTANNELMLLQTFRNTHATPQLRCPFFVWSGSTFSKSGHIPCTNARHLAPFSIDDESFVAVANYADRHGRTATNSEIYRFDRAQRKFQLFQRIRTYGAVDVQHFSVPFDAARRQHFVVFGNTLNDSSAGDGGATDADSVIYIYSREGQQFVPYQRLSFYAVQKFLPVQNADPEKFLLLVARSNQDIKIYNLNDWKFEESSTQFTEGALGRGVSNLRIYQENDTSYLVIANKLLSAVEANVFRPIFKRDEHANTLRQQIIEWSKTTNERLALIDVNQLKVAVEAKLAALQLPPNRTLALNVSDIASSNIKTVITKSLTYPRLHLDDNYWQALSYSNQALDALEAQLQQRRRRTRRATTTTAAEQPQDYESLRVRTLRVRNKLRAQRVNGVDAARPVFASVRAPKVIVTGSYSVGAAAARSSANETTSEEEPLTVGRLQIDGTLNGLTMAQLVNGTLKRTGKQSQSLLAPVSIAELQTPALAVRSGVANGRPLSQMVRIDGGDYELQQDVQFAAPVRAHNVLIRERLNNIQVRGKKLDVLLRRSNETQLVEGTKRFLGSIRVLEPITVAGRLGGKHFREISPISVMHEDLVLQGDYIIIGDVSVSELLSVRDDLMDENNRSARDVLTHGIRLTDGPLENLNLHFERPLVVNRSQVSFINAHDLQQLVKLNVGQRIQVIDGVKHFAGNLTISEGFAEVRQLNGIDVEALERRLFLKHTNQTIDVPMHLGTVLAQRVTAMPLTLNGSDLSAYLTRSSDQHITGALTVQRLTAQTLQTDHLNVNGRLLGQPLSAVYEQRAKNAPPPHIFQRERQFHGNIHVRNLQLTGALNGRPVAEIERQLAVLSGDIRYVGNHKFNHALSIEQLTFDGHLNGIAAAQLGRCWLQRSGAQDFTAPQTFAGIRSDGGMLLDGRLNGLRIDDFYTNAYWTDRDEFIAAAVLRSPPELRGTLNTATVNGLRVPEDMLYGTGATQPQVLAGDTVVLGDLLLSDGHQIANITSVNGLDLPSLQAFLLGEHDENAALHVEAAHFEAAPVFETLNKHDLRQTLDAVWLANENVDLTAQHVELAEANFEGLLDYEGPINNMNLRYLADNYLSLTKPQEIDTELVFSAPVTCKGSVQADHLHLSGLITTGTHDGQQLEFDFDDFVANTLKTSGAQTITGHWQLQTAKVEGDLWDVLLNNLTLADDVLLNSDTSTAPTRIANKTFSSAEIDQLYTTPTSRIAGVNVVAWFRDAVLVNGNYTIQGLTTMDTIELDGDLQVLGQVNNITFDADTLMLRDREQCLTGELRIHNNFPLEQRLLASNFERLQADFINGVNMTDFLATQARLSPTVQVHGHLIFQQPLLVNAYHSLVTNESGSSAQERQKRQAGKENLVDVIALPAAIGQEQRLTFYWWNATAQTFMPDDG